MSDEKRDKVKEFTDVYAAFGDSAVKEVGVATLHLVPNTVTVPIIISACVVAEKPGSDMVGLAITITPDIHTLEANGWVTDRFFDMLGAKLNEFRDAIKASVAFHAIECSKKGSGPPTPPESKPSKVIH